MVMYKSSSVVADKHLASRAFIDRRHDAEQYRREAIRLRREAGMKVDTTISEGLMVVAQRFDELAATIEIKQARNAALDLG